MATGIAATAAYFGASAATAATIGSVGAAAGTAVTVATAAGSAISQHNRGKRAASDSRDAGDLAMKNAKDRAAKLKEASAKRSSQFDGDEAKSNKSLLTAQKKRRREISGSAGTRLTGGKLGSPATKGGATLLGQ